MPPPNVTGSLHMGHAMFVTLEVRENNSYLSLFNGALNSGISIGYYLFINFSASKFL